MKTNSGGYMFVDPDYLGSLAAADEAQLSTDANDALVYFVNSAKQQKYGIMSQLDKYRYDLGSYNVDLALCLLLICVPLFMPPLCFPS